MMKGSWSIRELISWAKWGSLADRGHQVEEPLEWRWNEDISNLPHLLDELSSLIPPDSKEVFEKLLLSCFTYCLLNKREQTLQAAEYIYTRYPCLQVYFQLEPDELWNFEYASASWIGITESNKTGGIVGRVIVGTSRYELVSSPITPPWWDTMADTSARTALNDVILLIKNRLKRYVTLVWFFPERAIHGGSFSLSVYAAAWSAYSGKILSDSVVLSGQILGDGEVIRTSHIKKKRKIALIRGFRGFIYGSNGHQSRIETAGEIESISVCNLDDLDCLLELYEPGNVKQLHTIHDILKTPEALAARLHHLSEKTIKTAWFKGAYKKLLKKIFKNPSTAEEFATALEKVWQRFGDKPYLMTRILKPIREDQVIELARDKPQAAWTIAMCKSTCAAHEGDLTGATKWENIAGIATARILNDLGIIERRADLWNRHVVNSYHLAFRFSPVLPQPLIEIIRTLELIKKELSLNAMPVLGRLYGTVAQNYGFCGPQYLSQLEEYVEKAQAAFGNGKVEELREDWNRQWNYLIYAYLDANKYDDAEKALCSYLYVNNLAEIDSIENQSWNPFHKAALARFVADTGKYRELFDGIGIDIARGMVSLKHPWELWAFNVGRIQHDPKARIAMWNLSKEIAEHLKGPARALMLLPLAGMFVEELRPEKEIVSEFEKLKTHLESFPWLRQGHFKLLWNPRPKREIIEELWNNIHLFFPFTYR